MLDPSFLTLPSSIYLYLLDKLRRFKVRLWYQIMSHYLTKVSALDFKDTTAPRFGYCDVVFDIFIETSFLHLAVLIEITIRGTRWLLQGKLTLSKTHVLAPVHDKIASIMPHV